MLLEHLISTMHRINADFLLPMGCKAPVLTVNQTDFAGEENFSVGEIPVRMVSTRERGLSNSRNLLLEQAEGEICIIGDDDIVYVDGYEETVRRAYEDYLEADILCFRFALDEELTPRPHFRKACRVDLFKISKIASVEVTFRRQSVLKAGLRFDPLLGVGAAFGAGEENAFLADALRAGLKIQYVPETICYLQPTPQEREKWKNGFDREYFVKRGACFYGIYKGLFVPFALGFLLLKKRRLFRHICITTAFFQMLEGRKAYKRMAKGDGICF